MSGKFTNLQYDKEAYDDKIARTTNPLLYKLDPNYAVNCKSCFAPHGPKGSYNHDNARINGDIVANVGDKIDIDSILKGISKVNSKSNRQQIPDSLQHYPVQKLSECPNALESQYSRYTHPAHDVRGLTVPDMRFDYPMYDPQCQIFENFEVNTRLQSKDNHRAVWPTPLDQTKALPNPIPQSNALTFNCYCAYAPY